MVSPGRVTAQNLDYYERQVAQSAEEYFSGRGEADGTWIGSGVRDLKISGKRVRASEFNAVMSGKRPKEDELLADQFAHRKVLAVDMTFSPPKSVSVLWALAPEKVRSQIEEAHNAALLETFAYLEDNCAWGRQGKGGTRKVRGDGLTAAAYRHRTSREGDPQLHTHVVVANMVRFENGNYGSLDTARFWHQAPTLTTLYQRELRRRLTTDLGVEWGEIKHGMADIDGFPEELKTLFSKRHEQILEAAGKFGRLSAWARQQAAISTRQPKGKADQNALFSDWEKEAKKAGFSAEDLLALCNKSKLAAVTAPEIATAVKNLKADQILTSSTAHFARRHVIALFAAKLPAGVDNETIVRAADEYIRENLVQLNENGDAALHQMTSHAKAGESPLTSPEMYAIEQTAIAQVKGGLGRSAVRLTSEEIAEGLTRHAPATLGSDQRAMIQQILESGNMVDCVIGDAGTGKTFSFEIARKILEDNGFSMGGGALAAVAAEELGKKANMESNTVAALLYRIQKRSKKFMRELPDVLVIDEAAMVGTKASATIIEFCNEQNIKVVFVGDAKQIPAIEAGGMFSLIDNEIGAARLYENHRQKASQAQVELVNEWRDGHARVALSLAGQMGQLQLSDNEAETIERLLESWAADPQREDCLMMATRHVEVRALNNAAQATRLEAGEISGKPLDAGVYSYQIGDRIRCRARDYENKEIKNGTTGVVVGIKQRSKTVVIETDDGHRIELGRDYIRDPEKFQLGYAITTHSAQGSTCLRSYVALSQFMNREIAYTAGSRHTDAAYFFATREDAGEKHAGFEPDKDYDPLETLTYALEKSGAQLAAIALGEKDEYCDYSIEEIAGAINDHHEGMTRQVIAQYDVSLDGLTLDTIPEDVFIDPAIVKAWAEEHPEAAREYNNLRLELEMRVRHEAALATVSPPAWAVSELGPVPEAATARTYWRTGYKHIARHRARYELTGADTAYGAGTASTDEKRSATIARGRVNDARQNIASATTKITGAAL